jgi:hypothetical protein
MKAIVITEIRQEIEVPDGADQQAVLNFLSEYQNFRGAFVGISDVDDSGWRITEVQVIDETVTELGDIAVDD